MPPSAAEDKIFQLYATCPEEVKEAVEIELHELGARNITLGYKFLSFEADEETYYKCHLWSRLPSRIYRIIKKVPASSPVVVFDKTKRIKFHELFRHDIPLSISVASHQENQKVPNHLIGTKIREAITDSFKHFADKDALVSSRQAKINLRAFLEKNRITISIDTALKSLHKRGYRNSSHPAPIKETLAAFLLKICEYDGSTAFYDPMCGSGTIAIEAAMIAANRAPLLLRSRHEFGFEHLVDFNNTLWRKCCDDARASIVDPPHPIFAGDVSQEYIEDAKDNALRARVEKYMTFKQADFFESSAPASEGLLISNIPYGERLDRSALSSEGHFKEYYGRLGDKLKSDYKGWTCGFLVPKDSPYKHIGLKPNANVDLLNGDLPVKFITFEIY